MGGSASNINNTSILKGVFRFLIGFILLAPFGLPLFLIETPVSVGLLYIIKCAVPFFLLTFIMFSWLKSVYIVAQVINTNTALLTKY